MKLPLVSRQEYESKIVALEARIEKLEKQELRIRDLERQFATKYDSTGKIIETLADVPISERANVKVLRRPKSPLAGMSWQQRQQWLQETDGGRMLKDV